MGNKTVYIKDIKEKTPVEGIFLVREKNQGMKKSGDPYIALILSDSTGEVKARIWDDAERLGSFFSDGDIVKARAWAIIYQGTLQLNISGIERYAEEDLDIFKFLPGSKIDTEKCFQELLSVVEQVTDSHLQKLLKSVFDDAAIAEAFKKAPAAKSLHHACVGGLLEHTLTVTRLALDVSKHYPNVNRDLLLAGAMLHDIGKIHELSFKNSFDYTDEGRLVGHITIGVEIISERIRLIPEFPDDLALVVKHLILSHHGEYIFASPRRPKTLEALLLNYLDDLDSKMEGLKQFIRKEKKPDARWTGYNKLFDRYIYTETFIDDEPAEGIPADTE
ncbi:MAG: HD domain-containing protein [Proteobacteria bacterium]|nr:HD domain-containing protein [Pseudomonadota bacterium]